MQKIRFTTTCRPKTDLFYQKAPKAKTEDSQLFQIHDVGAVDRIVLVPWKWIYTENAPTVVSLFNASIAEEPQSSSW